MSKEPTKILLVEDNSRDIALLRAMLAQSGFQSTDFELVDASRLAAAIKQIRESDFGLVLLDLALPDSDGVATVARVREAQPALPIVVLTGQDDAGVAMDALRLGAQDYLVKGQFDAPMLTRAIRYAIERQRSEEQLRQQREKEAALRQVGEAIASTLELDTVLNLFLDKFASLFPDFGFTARLVNPRTGNLDPFGSRNVNEIRAKDDPFRPSGVRARAVMAQGEPLVLFDLLSESRLGNSQFVRHNGFVSYAGIPLIAKGKSIGVVGVYGKKRHAFDREEIEFFSALGRQAALGIYNSRVHEQAKNSHEREAVLRAIASAVAGTLDVRAVLNVLLANIHSRRPDLVANVRLLNKSIAEFMGLGPRPGNDDEWRDVAVARGRGLTKVIGDLRRPVTITDLQNDPRIGRPDVIRRRGFVSYLGVPLIVADDLLGVLNFFIREKYVFENEEVEFLRALAGQAAIALHNARLYESSKIARDRQVALREINSAITATLDLQTTLRILLDKVTQLLPGYAVTVRLAQAASGSWDGVACRNMDEAEWRSTAAPSGTAVADRVAAARKPIVLANVQSDPLITNHDFMRRNHLVSYAGVPMRVHDAVIGVLGFFTREPHEFDVDELEMVATLADQAAVALYNAQLYDRLKESKETLEKALEAKSVLVGVMAHELKTPIQVILGSAALLAENFFGALTPEQLERVRTIEAGCGELLQLIDQTLHMTRLERGETARVMTEVCVGTLVAELQAEFDEAFREKGIELAIDAPLPGVVAMKTDRIKLKEILRNLLDNARKFTVQGKATLRAAKIGESGVEFIVSDTGVGIRSDLLPKIFEWFYQVSYSTREKGSAGLGLSIVKRLVETLSGEIQVWSELGQGTTFRVTLPKEIGA